MATPAKKAPKPKKPLPQTPVRPKVVTEYMTPHQAAQWLADDFKARRNGR